MSALVLDARAFIAIDRGDRATMARPLLRAQARHSPQPSTSDATAQFRSEVVHGLPHPTTGRS